MAALVYFLSAWGLTPEYAYHVFTFLLIPHFVGTAAFYLFAYTDYKKELAVEARLGAAKKEEAAAEWLKLKHEHAYPLYKEEGGVRGAYRRILPQVLFVDLIVGPTLAFLWGWVPLVIPPIAWNWSDPVTTIGVAAVRVFAVGILYEVLLTAAHIFMHSHPFIYKLTHKCHHGGPQCALAGTYMSMWETSLNGSGLAFLTSGLMGLPGWVVVILAVLGRLNLGKVHSGWREIDRTGPPEAPFHGVHHTGGGIKVNYGSATWADKLLGTYRDAKTVFPASWPDASEHAKSS